MLTPARQKNRAETKQLKKEEKELNCNDQMMRDPEGITKVREGIQERESERESMEIRQ